ILQYVPTTLACTPRCTYITAPHPADCALTKLVEPVELLGGHALIQYMDTAGRKTDRHDTSEDTLFQLLLLVQECL
ncbi:hypothetical protein INR49_026349, partial [Caranx melampygus]